MRHLSLNKSATEQKSHVMPSNNQDTTILTGIVTEALPGAMFRVKVEDRELLAYASGKMRMNHIKILPGDKVTLEVTKYDDKRGRITRRM